jgi:DnaJ-domain-containing protein 1
LNVTETILVGVFIIVLGNIFGKALKSLNPFYIFMAFMLCIFPYYAGFGAMEDNTLPNAFLVLGIVSGVFKNPLTVVFAPFEILMVNLKLAMVRSRAGRVEKAGYARASEDIRRQAQETEDRLNRQKEDLEEDLRRQQAQAEAEIRRKAEELRQKEEELNRKAHRDRKEGKGGSDAGERPLDPTRLEDAYKILGVVPGLSLGEYKKAWRGLLTKYHPDKTAHLGEELQRVALRETQKINRAWDTIKKNFKI